MKKAIFAGTSNSMGLGLELEFSERYQDDDFLTNRARNIPPLQDGGEENMDFYTEEDLENQRKYRWPNLVCKTLGVQEININDQVEDYGVPMFNQTRQAVDIVFNLIDNKDDKVVRDFINETKYIFLEFGYIRWWDSQLHGTETNFTWPSTPVEIDRFLKRNDVDIEKKHKAIDWLNNVNPIELWERTIDKVKILKKEFPHIRFVLLAWGVNPDVFNLESTKGMIDDFVEMPFVNETSSKYNIGEFLEENKLTIKDTVKAFDKKYKKKWLYEDFHASHKGQMIVANQIINKLRNETRNLYSI